ncbi:MAG: hypothetical protein AB8B80_14680 [Marinicellaceae bacterium]
MSTLTSDRLIELEFERKEKDNTIYFQKNDLIIIYRDAGYWEYCADGDIELSGGLTFTTEAGLNEYINMS